MKHYLRSFQIIAEDWTCLCGTEWDGKVSPTTKSQGARESRPSGLKTTLPQGREARKEGSMYYTDMSFKFILYLNDHF